ncbi:MAG: hypothetical protein KKA90_01460 [Nanoarchaeota archaeon]|nr:hypothetical protein [Nanoarchaeota archaeon]
MSVKLVSFWILGGILQFAGIWILGNVQPGLGVSDFTYGAMLVLAFILILLAGLAWISVAVATRHSF